MLKGLDISHHNTVTAAGLSRTVQNNELYFCFLKATEGATIKDAKFTSYWQMSRDAGMICSAYHFLRPLTDPVLQANNFLAHYRKVSRNGVLPPVVDIEWAYVGKAPNQKEQWSQLAPAKRLQLIKSFLFVVEQALSTKPIIYTATSFWNDYIKPQLSTDDTAYFETHPLWIVDLKRTGKIPLTWSTSAFIQTHFGEHATTNDPYDHLDHDEFNGGLLQLLNMTIGGLTIAKGFPKSFIVKGIQTSLQGRGFLHDAADGIFGSNTDAAVKKFQSANGLVANGIIDMQTWNKILT